MKNTLHKMFRSILWLTKWFIGAIFIYLIAAIILSCVAYNRKVIPPSSGVDIYIISNGVHTDIVLPVINEYKDWSKFVKPGDTRSGNTYVSNVAFGWGDKGFFLHTKAWADLKFKTAFNALFYLSSSAMHVTYYRSIMESESCRKVCIDKEAYLKLVEYIDKSFEHDGLGNPLQIKGASYFDNDSFYEAKGKYGLFNTCNTWANAGLKDAGLKACLWTPFDKGIFYHY